MRLHNNEGTEKLLFFSTLCPSCYFVISQFCKKHPNIKVQVKYMVNNSILSS
ncbi:MAG TPA: deaminase domain-containing protein [Clostridium sp.]